MSPTTVLGYAAMAAGGPLEPFEYESPELGEHDVRVAVTHCGLCYSDIHAIADYYDITTYPFVPGHEIAGFVSAVGPSATGLKVGDRVGIGWQGRSCMRCEWCLRGDEQLCREIASAGVWEHHGGFSPEVVADSRFVYPLPDAMAPEVAAVLVCAGITVYSPLRRYVTEPSMRVGVVGVGGLGHLALQFARAFGCEVTAISSTPAKEEEARRFGADHFVVAGDRDQLVQMELSQDLLLYTAHNEIASERLLLTLKKNGRLVLMGFPRLTLEPVDLIVYQYSITGSFLGNRASMREMLSFAGAHGIAPVIELMPMAAVNEAIERVKENRARYRIVLVNG